VKDEKPFRSESVPLRHSARLRKQKALIGHRDEEYDNLDDEIAEDSIVMTNTPKPLKPQKVTESAFVNRQGQQPNGKQKPYAFQEGAKLEAQKKLQRRHEPMVRMSQGNEKAREWRSSFRIASGTFGRALQEQQGLSS